MQVIKLLVGNPPQTINDLIDVAGVTRTAITERLNELLSAGMVTRSTESGNGRGHPRYVYSLTNAAMEVVFARDHKVAMPAIWQAVRELGERAVPRGDSPRQPCPGKPLQRPDICRPPTSG